MDFRARDQRLKEIRVLALKGIMEDQGIAGILTLAEKGKTQRIIGAYLASDILTREQIEDLILKCLRSKERHSERQDIIAGALWVMDEDRRKTIYETLRAVVSEDEALHLLLLSPYRATTWKLVDQLSAMARSRYWMEVTPQYVYDLPEENNESIRRLIKVKRPRAAFESLDFALEEIPTSLLAQLLSAMAGQTQDKDREHRLDNYHVRHAFQLLDRNSDLSLEEKAGLEFAYLEILALPYQGDRDYQIPNLERYIEKHPELFVQAVVWAYKRDDLGEDPVELRPKDGCEHLVQRGWRLLDAMERIPGQDKATKEEQQVALGEWVIKVRQSCAELGREEIADVCLGKLLAKAPKGDDGVWPNEAVREVMEELKSENMSIGACTSLYNARGPYWRREGGDQERELANKYRVWAEALQFTHPFVSTSVLGAMVRTYEREAEQHDTEASIGRRLRQ